MLGSASLLSPFAAPLCLSSLLDTSHSLTLIHYHFIPKETQTKSINLNKMQTSVRLKKVAISIVPQSLQPVKYFLQSFLFILIILFYLLLSWIVCITVVLCALLLSCLLFFSSCLLVVVSVSLCVSLSVSLCYWWSGCSCAVLCVCLPLHSTILLHSWLNNKGTNTTVISTLVWLPCSCVVFVPLMKRLFYA